MAGDRGDAHGEKEHTNMNLREAMIINLSSKLMLIVPSLYNFTSILKHGNYKLESTICNTLSNIKYFIHSDYKSKEKEDNRVHISISVKTN